MDFNKIYKHINETQVSKEEATPEVDENQQLMDKIMAEMNKIQEEKDALVSRVEEIESKKRKDLAEMKAKETLMAISKALNISK